MLSRAFAHPVSRVLLLAGTFAATVATSAPPPDWNLESQVPEETVTLGPEQTLERKYVVEDNVEKENATLSLSLVNLSPAGRLQLDTTAEGEPTRAVTMIGENGRWQPEGSTSAYDDLPTIQRTQFGNGRWTSSLRVTNAGSTPLTFTVRVVAQVYGYDDQPAGAFVKVERSP